MKSSFKFLAASAILLSVGEICAASQVFIPVTGANAETYDTANQTVYITTSTGSIARYNLGTQQALSSWTLGNNLCGIDITPDNSNLVVSNVDSPFTVSTPQGEIYKINTTTGATTTLNFNRTNQAAPDQYYENGSYGMVALDNNTALFTGSFAGLGYTPLRRINLTTGAITQVSVPIFDSPGSNSRLYRSADRSTVMVEDVYDGLEYVYNSSFGGITSFQGDSLNLHANGATNRDGSIIAAHSRVDYGDQIRLYSGNLGEVLGNIRNLGNGGYTFDPVRDVMYVVDVRNSLLISVNTNTMQGIAAEYINYPVAEASQFGEGYMTTSADGQYVFLTNSEGVIAFDTASLVPEPTSISIFAISAFGALLRRRRNCRSR